MVPYQALPLLQIFIHNISHGRNLKGEPGNEATAYEASQVQKV